MCVCVYLDIHNKIYTVHKHMYAKTFILDAINRG